MSIVVSVYPPLAALENLVLCYWDGTFKGSPTATLEQKVMPTGYIELVLHLSSGRCELKINNAWKLSAAFSLVGFWTDPYLIRFRDQVETFGIRFKPEALYTIFGIPAAEFINCSANLEEIFDPSFASFCLNIEELKTIEERIKLADAYLLKRLLHSENSRSYVQSAAALIREQSNISVAHLSKEVCICTRQLEREFKNKLGLSPKSYIRISRLNSALQCLNQNPSISLAQLSYQCGYADQAHFIREFKALTGELPSVYASELPTLIVA